MRSSHVAALGVALTLAGSAPARAQGGPEAARQALIQEAAAAAQAGDHARAITYVRRAAELRDSPSLQFLLAREELALGLPLEAYAHADACVEAVRAAPALPNRDTLLSRCEALRAETARSLARLTLRAPSPRPPGLSVTVDGLPFELASLDVARVRLPGAVEVAATATGRAPFRETRTLAAGSDETLTLALPIIEAPRVTVELPPPVRLTPRPAPSRSYAGPVALAGVAVAGAVAVGVLGGLALDAQRERDAVCASSASCDLAGAQSADARYRDLALGANVSLVVAGSAAAAALSWWLVTRFARSPTRAAFTPAGLVLRW